MGRSSLAIGKHQSSIAKAWFFAAPLPGKRQERRVVYLFFDVYYLEEERL
jgi:hypothetical protein